MAFSAAMTVIIIFGMILGVGAIAIVTEHLQKMAQIKARGQQRGNEEIVKAVEMLRREVAQLRDTTTQYDVSFDAALQRLESRVANLETRTRALEQGSASQQMTTGR
jgi:cell division protein FtsI/penicillin-binding protein 2